MPVESPGLSDNTIRETKKNRGLLARLYVSFWKRWNVLGAPAIALLRAVERRFGPAGVAAVLLPVVGLDFVRRLVDLAEFRKVRRILPAEFWRGLGAWRHAFLMARNWDNSLAAAFLCDRLDQPAWSERFRVRGVRPDHLAESSRRPVILVHLHTGAYGFLHYWLRAQRLRATCFWGGNPLIFQTPWARRIFDEADRIYGLEDIPRLLHPRELRATLNFLVPGNILTVAMDTESATSALYDANGYPICLSEGIVHLAQASNALLVPASVVLAGDVRFDVRFGTPVPDEMVDKRHPRPAMQFLLDQLWKDVEEDPSRLGWNSLLTLDPRSKPHHIPWP